MHHQIKNPVHEYYEESSEHAKWNKTHQHGFVVRLLSAAVLPEADHHAADQTEGGVLGLAAADEARPLVVVLEDVVVVVGQLQQGRGGPLGALVKEALGKKRS